MIERTKPLGCVNVAVIRTGRSSANGSSVDCEKFPVPCDVAVRDVGTSHGIARDDRQSLDQVAEIPNKHCHHHRVREDQFTGQGSSNQ